MVNPLLGHKVYVDASVLIYATETPHLFPNLRPFLIEPLSRGELTLITSWITLSEVLVRPLQLQHTLLEMAYRQFLTPSRWIEVLPVDQAISSLAAELRASQGIKLPDAIHIATGKLAGCTCYLTGDARWSRAGIPVLDVGTL